MPNWMIVLIPFVSAIGKAFLRRLAQEAMTGRLREELEPWADEIADACLFLLAVLEGTDPPLPWNARLGQGIRMNEDGEIVPNVLPFNKPAA